MFPVMPAPHSPLPLHFSFSVVKTLQWRTTEQKGERGGEDVGFGLAVMRLRLAKLAGRVDPCLQRLEGLCLLFWTWGTETTAATIGESILYRTHVADLNCR